MTLLYLYIFKVQVMMNVELQNVCSHSICYGNKHIFAVIIIYAQGYYCYWLKFNIIEVLSGLAASSGLLSRLILSTLF